MTIELCVASLGVETRSSIAAAQGLRARESLDGERGDHRVADGSGVSFFLAWETRDAAHFAGDVANQWERP